MEQKNTNSTTNNGENGLQHQQQDFDEWLIQYAKETGEDYESLRKSFEDSYDPEIPEYLTGSLKDSEKYWLKREISYLRQELKIERAGNLLLKKELKRLQDGFDFEFGKTDISVEKKIIEKAMGFNQMPLHVEDRERKIREELPPTGMGKFYKQLTEDRKRFNQGE